MFSIITEKPALRRVLGWQSVNRILSTDVRFCKRGADGRSFIWALDYSRARVVAHATPIAALSAIIACATTAEHGLALSKDFAVSLPLCCPYSGIGPSSSGWGPPRRFQHGRHCSHLYSYERRPLAATFLSFRTLCLRTEQKESVRIFLCAGVAF